MERAGTQDVAEQTLDGGNVNAVVRVGDTVRRSAGPWTPTVHALLAWVRARGVTCLPAPLGRDDEGREVLGWVPGDVVGWPAPAWLWDARTRAQAGATLRAVHDATVGFDLAGAVWRSPAHAPAEVVCLNDVAPYNMVFDGTELVGLIDVDMASPGPRAWDLAYLAYRLCGWCEDTPAPDDAAPAERLADLLAAYGADAAPTVDDVLTTMVVRLHDLADWTDAHARTTGRPDLHEHAAMYRRDAERVAAGRA
ncbi:phosphotransferase [Cellulomonas sp. B6]|uniref:phosphotransferase n=1 Tax=Cellulomonas sp. B6 TaxID=1295626 RepID=UPI00073BEBEF|nr:phosphotransferase [Cellulomonas sp. B6]KSW30134.1 hypothetical protein ATM99_04590 [Cellulomonas sp. B6]